MPDKQKKPKSPKQGATASNLLASMPWLTKKTFLIPALSSVLVVSLVGVVSAVQGGVFGLSNQDSAEVTLEESISEEAIGFACVSGTEICEEVKSILLGTAYDEVVANWTRESLIAHLEYKYGRSRIFATEVVDAVKFDWGDGSSIGACVSGELACDQARYVLITTDQGKIFTRDQFVSTWMDWYGVSREQVEAIIDELGFTNWAGSTNAGGNTRSGGSSSAPSGPQTNLPNPSAPAQSGLSPSEAARSTIESVNAFGSAYSRLQIIDYMVSNSKFDRTVATSALDGLGVDWNLQATKAARYFTNQTSLSHLSRSNFQEMLTDKRWTASEATYGVDSLGIDWNAQASRAGKKMLEVNHCMAFVVQSEFGPSADIDELASYIMGTWKFTQDEAYSGALDQLEMEGDWVWKVFPNCVP